MPISHKKPADRRQGHRPSNDLGTLVTFRGKAAKSEAPPAPKGLVKAARDAWDGFWSSPVAQAVDRDADMPALRRWIEATNERERLAKAVRKTPLVEGSKGQPVLNPLAGLLKQLEVTICRAEAEFGMTPWSRLRLGIAPGQANRSLHDLIDDLDGNDEDDTGRDQILRPVAIDGAPGADSDDG